jgi:group I intron endonuclease
MTDIYCIVCVTRGAVYIGKTVNLDARIRTHLSSLRNSTHNNQKLQADFTEYGASDFIFCVLESCADEESDWKERYWINEYSHTCYNIEGNFAEQPKDEKQSVRLHMTISPKLDKQLEVAEKKLKMNRSAVIRLALENFLKLN